jgi:hypothetical protein
LITRWLDLRHCHYFIFAFIYFISADSPPPTRLSIRFLLLYAADAAMPAIFAAEKDDSASAIFAMIPPPIIDAIDYYYAR